MKVTYPAIFTSEVEGGYSVRFYDIPNAVTCGDNLTEAIEMAEDVLGGILALDFIEVEKKMPETTNPLDIETNDLEFVSLITVNPFRYVESTKTVRKNVTVPEWLAKRADKSRINFSETLTQALIDRLDV